ncbi:hypothetical protein H920_10958 [Fukomys damarensis]|uniref:Uncharacterized protein n=1 Tax=Fukomys damarensis TaxID=885580 RepID=A0A091D9A2_FUKDA|nr:hypothetical protein H920_10958 [Fukomys damarensis]
MKILKSIDYLLIEDLPLLRHGKEFTQVGNDTSERIMNSVKRSLSAALSSSACSKTSSKRDRISKELERGEMKSCTYFIPADAPGTSKLVTIRTNGDYKKKEALETTTTVPQSLAVTKPSRPFPEHSDNSLCHVCGWLSCVHSTSPGRRDSGPVKNVSESISSTHCLCLSIREGSLTARGSGTGPGLGIQHEV